MASSSASALRILGATARDRVVVSYAVDPARVAPRLPAGLVPDTRGGRAYVSLVGVRLTKVRVLGVAGPGLRRVPAVELQALVREEGTDRRGTMTIQAHVPRRLVAWGARLLYGESVEVVPMQPVRRELDEGIEMTYRFDTRGREQRLRVVGQRSPAAPPPESLEAFLQNRQWRYGTGRGGTLLRARIERDDAPVRSVDEQYVTVRWAAVYGEAWAMLKGRAPAAALFSPGGPLTLRWRHPVP